MRLLKLLWLVAIFLACLWLGYGSAHALIFLLSFLPTN